MFSIYCDDELVYAPNVVDQGFVVLSPMLTKEVNKAGSLEFTLPESNPKYSSYSKLKSIFTVKEDGKEIWRGRVLNDERDFYKNKALFCEGELAFLNDVPFPPYDYSTGITIQQYFQNVFSHYLDNCSTYRQLHLGKVNGTSSTSLIKSVTKEYSNILTDISNNVIDPFEGYLVTRRDESQNKTYVDYYADQSNLSLQTIKFGENLLDLTEYIDASGIYTRIIPLGKADDEGNRVDISSVNGGVKYLRSTEGENLFGIITVTVTNNDIEDPSELKTYGQTLLDKALKESLTITIKAVDLHRIGVNTEAIDAGKYVRVVSVPHGIDDHYLCTKMVLDLTDPSNSEYTFGVSIPEITSTSKDVNNKINQVIENLSKEIDANGNSILDIFNDVIDRINGAKGGYKITEYDENGLWLRDLYMNAPSKEQATNIMQINNQGIAFSTNGYDGPYSSAWAINGQFVADWIVAGTMSAYRIHGGELLANNYDAEAGTGMRIDLDNGIIDASKLNLSDYMKYDETNEVVPFTLGGWQVKYRDIEDPEYTGPAEYWDTVGTQQNGIGARGPWVVWGGWSGSHAYDPSYYNFLVTDDGTCKAMDWITGSRAELKKDIHEYDKSGLQQVLDSSVYYYKLKNENSKWKQNDRDRVGFIIGDDYPLSNDLLDGSGGNVDMYASIAIAYKAIQELNDKIWNIERWYINGEQ